MLDITKPNDLTKLKIYKPLVKLAREEGRKEGREETLYLIATNMIVDGFEDSTIHKITGLSLKKIQELRLLANTQK